MHHADSADQVCASAFDAVGQISPDLTASAVTGSHNCRIHCLNHLNKATPYFYISLYKAIKDVENIEFRLIEISAGCVVFNISFEKSSDLIRFHELCSTGKLNAVARSHRVYQVDFSDRDLPSITYKSIDFARYLPVN